MKTAMMIMMTLMMGFGSTANARKPSGEIAFSDTTKARLKPKKLKESAYTAGTSAYTKDTAWSKLKKPNSKDTIALASDSLEVSKAKKIKEQNPKDYRIRLKEKKGVIYY